MTFNKVLQAYLLDVKAYITENEIEALKIHPNSSEMVGAWQYINNLSTSVRTKILNLEVTSKLKSFGTALHDLGDPVKAKKNAQKIIKGIDQAVELMPTRGNYVANKIKNGDYDDVENYISFIKHINRNGNAVPSESHKIHPAAQTLRRMDASDIPNNRKVLEKQPNQNSGEPHYDIDYGEEAQAGGDYFYDRAFQLKSAADSEKAKNAIQPSKIEEQLLNTDAKDRIFEVEMRSGTIGELETQGFFDRVNDAKGRVPRLIINITDTNGVILKTY